MRVLTVAGTRPEAIKLAPVLRALEARRDIERCLCLTGQHGPLVEGALAQFGLAAQCKLGAVAANRSLERLVAQITAGVAAEIRRLRPDRLLVQGDTATALGAAMAARECGIRLAHVEAGLRSDDLENPWPEESYRRRITALADLHFAPTRYAAHRLEDEGIDAEQIQIPGNPGIDALHWTQRRLEREEQLARAAARRFAFLETGRRLLLATSHRRERRAARIDAFCKTLLALAERGDLEIVLPLPPNPRMARPLQRRLDGHPRLHLIAPSDYPGCVHLLQRAALVLTDSGGLQEEAPALGKPVMVLRETTERPEAVWAGAAEIVGLSSERAIAAANALLDDSRRYAAMARVRPIFGDGAAAERIAQAIAATAGDDTVTRQPRRGPGAASLQPAER